MISKTHRIVGAVELGTGKVSALVGEISRGRTLNIIGVGLAQSHGVMKGEVVDYKAACEATHYALERAEKKAGTHIDEVWLAQTGGHIDSFYNEVSLAVKSADNIVTQLDIATACQLAQQKELPVGRSHIHAIRFPFRIDGRSVTNPEHHIGNRLEVGYWIVHGEESKISDNIHVVSGYHLKVRELVLSALASGSLLTTEEEQLHGVLVLDIGKGVTDYVVYRNGHVFATGVLPIGGDHFTNDLSIGLRVTVMQAEMLKLRYGCGMVQTHDRNEKVWLTKDDMSFVDRQISKNTIEIITATRAHELFEVVKKKLGLKFAPERCRAGVVLTGGAAKLSSIDEAANRVFGLPVRRCEPLSWVKDELNDPIFSTVLGIYQFGLRAACEHPARTQRKVGLFSKLKNFFS